MLGKEKSSEFPNLDQFLRKKNFHWNFFGNVLTLYFLKDVCTEAAVKVNISPVALDFFTLVSEDGSLYLNPDKMLSEGECGQATYLFKLCIKACHGQELRDLDKQAFEYYFHQVSVSYLEQFNWIDRSGGHMIWISRLLNTTCAFIRWVSLILSSLIG